MVTKIEETDSNWLVTLEGEMDTVAAMEASEVLSPLYSGGKDVVIECEKLEYIASSGLRIFLGILKGATATNHTVTLRNVNEDIKNVLSLTGFIKIFNFE